MVLEALPDGTFNTGKLCDSVEEAWEVVSSSFSDSSSIVCRAVQDSRTRKSPDDSLTFQTTLHPIGYIEKVTKVVIYD